MKALLKTAKLSTPQEKMKAKLRYQKNKIERGRKAKRRKMMQDAGLKRKKKRIGTASGGYSFVNDPSAVSSGGGGGGGGGGAQSISGGTTNFNPEANTRSTEQRSRLKSRFSP